jgi:2-polyprenyl-6-methoxyphenol hydroxylase-like FAD-dependent oxidoreductase
LKIFLLRNVKVMAHEALDFNRAGDHDGDVVYEARYVIGTGGANSAVRRMLCIVLYVSPMFQYLPTMRQPFEGFNYSGWKMIGTDVLYDFPKH